MHTAILRTVHEEVAGRTRPPRRVWWVFSYNGFTKGRPGETRAAVLARHAERCGKATKLTRFAGVMRRSEAAMTVWTRPPRK